MAKLSNEVYTASETVLNRGQTEENTRLGIIIPIGYFKYFIQSCDLFSNSSLPDIYFPNPQWGILSPIGYIMANWGFNIPNWQ